jgi:hypothetical protein
MMQGIPTSFCDAKTTLVPAVSLHTEKIRVSPMRIRGFQASLRSETFQCDASHSALQDALHRLFMEVMRYFHEHLEVKMPATVRDALKRVHEGAQGAATKLNNIFIDLRIIEACVASGDPVVALALKESLEALAALRQ